MKSIFMLPESILVLKTGFHPKMFFKSSSLKIFFYFHISALEYLGIFRGQSNSQYDEQEAQLFLE